jgi:hypothetical protein
MDAETRVIIEKLIAKLREYAEEDDYADGMGGGCMSDPKEFVRPVIEEAEKFLAKE